MYKIPIYQIVYIVKSFIILILHRTHVNIGYVFLHRKPDVSGLTATLMEISVIPLLFLYALFFKKTGIPCYGLNRFLLI